VRLLGVGVHGLSNAAQIHAAGDLLRL